MDCDKGMLFVISSPSGGGKTTIIQSLKEMDLNLAYSISATTRSIRKGEEEGKDYYFIGKNDFEKHLASDNFIESAVVHGNHYGTFRSQIEDFIKAGKSVILDVDVQGAIEIKKKYPEAVLVFLLPPSIQVLEARLRNRGTDSEAVVQRRLDMARTELEMADHYDFQIINNDLESTKDQVVAIIKTCQKAFNQ